MNIVSAYKPSRRDVLRSATISSLGWMLSRHVAFGDQPLGDRIYTQADDYWFNPIRPYLEQYRLPAGQRDFSKAQVMEFDLRMWGAMSYMAPVRETIDAGRLTLKRIPGDRSVRYEVFRSMDNYGYVHDIRSEVECGKDRWLTPLRWETEYTLGGQQATAEAVELCKWAESGEYDGRAVILKSGGCERRVACPNPLSCFWMMLDVPPMFDEVQGDAQLSFSNLEDLSVLREKNSLRKDGEDRLDRSGTDLHSFLHCGEGTMPTHYLLDGQGRPLFVTRFFLSYILKSIASL